MSKLHCQYNKMPDHSLLEFKSHINDMVYHDINADDPLSAQTSISQTKWYENAQSVNFDEIKALTV